MSGQTYRTKINNLQLEKTLLKKGVGRIETEWNPRANTRKLSEDKIYYSILLVS